MSGMMLLSLPALDVRRFQGRKERHGLYKMKYQFVPRDPAAKKDFDADLSLITDLGGKYYPG